MVARNEGADNGNTITNSDHSKEPGDSRQTPLGPSKKEELKKRIKKRARGQKAKNRVVVAIGEGPSERKLRKGKVREFNILRKGDVEQAVPRKTRQFIARLAKLRDETSKSGRESRETESKLADTEKKKRDTEKRARVGKGGGLRLENEVRTGNNTMKENKMFEKNKWGKEAESRNDAAVRELAPSKERKFDGMQPGESFAQFSARLRKESKQMVLDLAKKSNHQREKKRAYYEKRKEAAVRRKGRKRGALGDSDVEDKGDDGDKYEETAHLPSYWQEIIRNNGRPISAKQRKRMNRAAQGNVDEVVFGEQADRPPKLSVRPVRRGRQDKQ